MRKDKAGRASISFEGFAFASTQQMEELLAPFTQAESVHLEGRVAGRQVKISRGRCAKAGIAPRRAQARLTTPLMSPMLSRGGPSPTGSLCPPARATTAGS